MIRNDLGAISKAGKDHFQAFGKAFPSLMSRELCARTAHVMAQNHPTSWASWALARLWQNIVLSVLKSSFVFLLPCFPPSANDRTLLTEASHPGIMRNSSRLLNRPPPDLQLVNKPYRSHSSMPQSSPCLTITHDRRRG